MNECADESINEISSTHPDQTIGRLDEPDRIMSFLSPERQFEWFRPNWPPVPLTPRPPSPISAFDLRFLGEVSGEYTVVLWSKIEKKHRQNSHPINHCPTSEGMSEVSERASERTSERSGGRERSE